MAAIHYLDFDLSIEPVPRARNRYRARVLNSPAGQASTEFRLPFSPIELENYILKMGRARQGVRGLHSSEGKAAQEFGRRLYEAIFQDQVRDCLRSSLAMVDRQSDQGLRIRLRLTDAQTLADMPWEYLYDLPSGRFFVHSKITPIVRYLDLPQSIQPLTVQLPLRVLVMISSPRDAPPLDVEAEWHKMQEALADLVQKGLVTITRLEKATLGALQRQLRPQHYHIFHFIGHGGFDQQTQEGVLLLEAEHGLVHIVSGDRLSALLHDHRSLRLIVLNACEGTRTAHRDPFAGVAQRLVQQGLPAVIAMQFKISDQAAKTLAHEFYAALADGEPVDAALAEARKAIYATNDIEWGTPVLYLRAADGVLFDIRDADRKDKPEQPNIPLAEPGKPPLTDQPTVQLDPLGIQVEPPASVSSLEGSQSQPSELALEQSVTLQSDAHQEAKSAQTAQPPPPQTSPSVDEHNPTASQSVETLDLSTIKPVVLHVLKGHNKQVNSVAFSPDGSLLASGSGGAFMGRGPLRLWRVADGKQIKTIEGHTKSVNSIAFSPDGRLLAAGSADHTIRLWQVEDGQLLHTLNGSYIQCVAFSPDGRLLAAGLIGGTIRLWQVEDGQLLHTLKGYTSSVWSVAFSPDGRLLAVGSEDKTIRLWQVGDDHLPYTLQGDMGKVKSVAFSPDGLLLASGSDDSDPIAYNEGIVRLWRVLDRKHIRTLHPTSQFAVRSVAFSPDGRLLAAGLRSREQPSSFAELGKNHVVQLWQVEAGQLLHTLKGHTSFINSVAFSPNGRLLAAGSDDQTIRIWQLK